MVEPLPGRPQPTDDTLVWRYMDFTKFVDLISTNRLFFSRADKLGDPFEGTYTATHVPSESDLDGLKDGEKEQLRSLRYFEIAAAKDNRKLFYINCWHANPGESAGMWRLYSQSNESVAVQTTFGKLKAAFPLAPYKILAGPVNYLDYRTATIKELRGQVVFMSKRWSFEHEQEVRLLFWSVDDAVFCNTKENHEPPPGYPVECELEELIQKAYVSPTSPDWFLGLVSRMCSQFGVRAGVVRSDLASSPFS